MKCGTSSIISNWFVIDWEMHRYDTDLIDYNFHIANTLLYTKKTLKYIFFTVHRLQRRKDSKQTTTVK